MAAKSLPARVTQALVRKATEVRSPKAENVLASRHIYYAKLAARQYAPAHRARSKYTPHQGEREKARRRGQAPVAPDGRVVLG